MNGFVIIGLENQASRGVFARHSVAGRLVDSIALAHSAEWKVEGRVEAASIRIKGHSVMLVKLSEGKLHEAGEILAHHLLPFPDPRRVIVAYDEALLPIGQAEIYTEPIVQSTHMGLKSLIKDLGTSSFVQVGIGIDQIPQDKLLWDEFFNAELTYELSSNVNSTFVEMTKRIATYIAYEASRKWMISEQDMLHAQLPSRVMNLELSPFVVRVTKRQKQQIEKHTWDLLKVIREIANKYAQACHEDARPDENELVRLLEFGIPKEMIPLARTTAFHSDNLSFDIQSGMLVEINASPMPALTVMNLADRFSIAGDILTLEMLTCGVVRLANRSMKYGGGGKILLLNQIGEVAIGRTGWLIEVQKYLQQKGFEATIGSREDNPDADVIWANLTWMTPDRIPSVVIGLDTTRKVSIFPSPRNFLFTSKWFLGLLHDEYAREVFELSAGQTQMIEEFIPRTFLLSDSLAKTLLETKTKWYMKPFLSSGGRGGGRLSSSKSHKKIVRPAVIQEWADPYRVQNSEYRYDIRLAYYTAGNSGHITWSARVWYQTESLQRPMDALVTIE